MAESNEEPQFARIVQTHLTGVKGRLIPEKAALLRILYCDKEISPTSSLSKMPIAKFLFESQVGHIESYINLGSDSLIKSDGHGGFMLKDVDEFPEDLREIRSFDALLEAISHWEKKIPERSEATMEKLRSILKSTELSLQVLLDKYGEIVNGLSGTQIEKICESIRNKSFDKGLGFKLLARISPAKSDMISRLFFDSIMYSTYCLILGLKLGSTATFKKYYFEYLKTDLKMSEPEAEQMLNKRNDSLKNTIKQITILITRSQGNDGMWSLRDYDDALKIKDTGTLLYLLKEIHLLIPDAEIELEKIKRAREFILNKMVSASKDGKNVIELKEEFLRQTDLYATIQAIAGVYCANIILGLSGVDVFKHPFVIGFFHHLDKLFKDGGFAMNEKGEAEIETTAFVVNSLFGKHSFALTEKEFATIAEFSIKLADVIHFYHKNIKAIEQEMKGKRHLNKVADSFLALLSAGVWPCSSYVLKEFTKTCNLALGDIMDFKDIKIFDRPSSQPLLSIGLATKYYSAMPAIHVLHNAIIILEMMYRYFERPNDYWENTKEILAKVQR